MPSNESELLRTARNIARLQTQCRKLRRQLKVAKADLRLERKHLKALGGLVGERRPDVIPSKVFGDGVGHVVVDSETTIGKHLRAAAEPKSVGRGQTPAAKAAEDFVDGLEPLDS